MRLDWNFRRVLFTIPESYSRKALILGFFFLLIFKASTSEGIDVVNNLNFDFYSQEHGLSNSQIHSIIQGDLTLYEKLPGLLYTEYSRENLKRGLNSICP